MGLKDFEIETEAVGSGELRLIWHKLVKSAQRTRTEKSALVQVDLRRKSKVADTKSVVDSRGRSVGETCDG